MRVKTILNRVERHPGFVYGDALLDKDVRLLVPVTARKGVGRSVPVAARVDLRTTRGRHESFDSCLYGGLRSSSFMRCEEWTVSAVE